MSRLNLKVGEKIRIYTGCRCRLIRRQESLTYNYFYQIEIGGDIVYRNNRNDDIFEIKDENGNIKYVNNDNVVLKLSNNKESPINLIYKGQNRYGDTIYQARNKNNTLVYPEMISGSYACDHSCSATDANGDKYTDAKIIERIIIDGTADNPTYAYGISRTYINASLPSNYTGLIWINEAEQVNNATSISKATNINGYLGDSKTTTTNEKSYQYSSDINDPSTKTDIYTLSSKARKRLKQTSNTISGSIFNMGIIDREESVTGDDKDKRNLLLFNKFDRNGCVDPYNGFIGSKEYVFFTRPDLHLFQNISSSELNEELLGLPFFEDAFERYPLIFQSLQSSWTSAKKYPFINLLSNTIASPISLPDINMQRNIESGTNAYGTKIMYHGTSHPSDEDITFSIEFTDNRYLEVFMLFKLYDEYERQKLLGWITPRTTEYIINKILSDQISIFKIVVAEDGESILYMCKWTGCIPTSVPTDALSDMASINGNLNISIQWHAQFFDDFDRDIMQDFNVVVANHVGVKNMGFNGGNKDIKLFDPVTGMSNGEWASFPYIAKDTAYINDRIAKMRMYKLKWRNL